MSGDRSLMAAVRLYLAERRALGYELAAPGTELMRFARYADARGHHGPLTSELIVGWAREHVKRTTEVTAARRLEIVRPFAAYYRQFEPATEIPPVGVLGRGHRRLVPHIYSDEEVVQLLQAASRLTPRNALRPLTYRALFGLIAAAGLRLSEALNLTNGDVDLVAQGFDYRFGVILNSLNDHKYLKGTEWPIRCRGSVNVPAKDWCRPDMDAIGKVVQNAAKLALREKATEKLGEKLGLPGASEAEVKAEVKQKAQEKVNEQVTKQFDKWLKRNKKEEAPAAPEQGAPTPPSTDMPVETPAQ